MLKYPGKKYHAKILLFGEYTVIINARAVTIPYRDLFGRFMFYHDRLSSEYRSIKKSSDAIKKFVEYIKELQQNRKLKCSFSTGQLNRDLEKGLFFTSNIPVSYGVGSSGALCAAIYDNYCVNPRRANSKNNEVELTYLRKQFAILESYFHIQSSGIDPLSCYVNRPLVFHGDRKISTVTLPEPTNDFSFFLADTKIIADTGPLVKWFLDHYKKEPYRSGITDEFIPLVKENIKLLLDGNSSGLFRQFKTLSQLQLDYFDRMIPAFCSVYWKYGLTSDLFYLKLCGSGGGGFLLGYTKDIGRTEDYFRGEGIRIYKVSL